MACERFTEEGLTVFPMTPEREAHLAGCEDCRAAASRFARLERLIALAHLEAVPPEGWEARLEAALATGRPGRSARRPRRTALGVVGGGLLVAGLAGVLVFRTLGEGGVVSPSVSAIVELPTGMRATTAAVGGRYRIEVRSWKEARVWLNGRTLVGRCPGGEGCEVTGSGLRLSIPLRSVGEYRVMVLQPGEGALEEPASLDEDVQRVRQAKGTYEVLEPLSVY